MSVFSSTRFTATWTSVFMWVTVMSILCSQALHEHFFGRTVYHSEIQRLPHNDEYISIVRIMELVWPKGIKYVMWCVSSHVCMYIDWLWQVYHRYHSLTLMEITFFQIFNIFEEAEASLVMESNNVLNICHLHCNNPKNTSGVRDLKKFSNYMKLCPLQLTFSNFVNVLFGTKNIFLLVRTHHNCVLYGS